MEPEQESFSGIARGVANGAATSGAYCAMALLPLAVRSKPMPSASAWW